MKQASAKPFRLGVAVACGAMLNLGYMSLWLQPAVVGEITGTLGLPVDQAGVIATVETLLVSGMLLFASRWKGRIPYRNTALVGLALTVAATLACFRVDGFVGLLAARSVGAIGFGLMLVVPNMALASFERTDLMFGRLYTLNLMWSAAILFLLPVAQSFGLGPAAFVGYLVSAVVMLPLFLLMPAREGSAPEPATVSTAATAEGVRLAGGAAAVGLGYGLLWAFFMILGKRAGLTDAGAITASSLSLVGAFLGSALASQSTLFSVTRPIFVGVLALGAAALMCLTIAPPPAVFTLAGMVAMFAMYFFFPTVLGAAGNLDGGGRSIALINGSLSTCSGIGPLIGGLVLARGGPQALGVLSAAAVLIAIAAFDVLWRTTAPARAPAVQNAA